MSVHSKLAKDTEDSCKSSSDKWASQSAKKSSYVRSATTCVTKELGADVLCRWCTSHEDTCYQYSRYVLSYDTQNGHSDLCTVVKLH